MFLSSIKLIWISFLYVLLKLSFYFRLIAEMADKKKENAEKLQAIQDYLANEEITDPDVDAAMDELLERIRVVNGMLCETRYVKNIIMPLNDVTPLHSLMHLSEHSIYIVYFFYIL